MLGVIKRPDPKQAPGGNFFPNTKNFKIIVNELKSRITEHRQGSWINFSDKFLTGTYES